jgi:hypothetical protein
MARLSCPRLRWVPRNTTPRLNGPARRLCPPSRRCALSHRRFLRTGVSPSRCHGAGDHRRSHRLSPPLQQRPLRSRCPVIGLQPVHGRELFAIKDHEASPSQLDIIHEQGRWPSARQSQRSRAGRKKTRRAVPVGSIRECDHPYPRRIRALSAETTRPARGRHMRPSPPRAALDPAQGTGQLNVEVEGAPLVLRQRMVDATVVEGVLTALQETPCQDRRRWPSGSIRNAAARIYPPPISRPFWSRFPVSPS